MDTNTQGTATVPPTTPPPVTPPTPLTTITPNQNNGSISPTPSQSGIGNPTGNGSYGPTVAAPYGYSTVNGKVVANTGPVTSSPALFGISPSGTPYGSQNSNNPNPDASVYGVNGQAVQGSPNSLNPNGLTPSEQAYEDTINGFNDKLNGIINGTTPLTTAEEAQIQGLQTQYAQLIQKQQNVNANNYGTAELQGAANGGIGSNPYFQANTITDIVAAGSNQISNLQIQEASAVASLTESLQQNDVKGIQDAYNMYTSSHADVAAAIQKVVSDTQDAMQDQTIATVIASGVTDPADILSTLQKQGYTDISLDDINTAIKNLSPDAANIFTIQKDAAANGAPQSVLASIGAATNQQDAMTAAGIYNTTMIPDLQKTAEANGAPQSVISAIGQATDSASALEAAAGYTQTATGVLGDYLEYQRQAIAAGQVPEDYQTYEKAQQAQTSATAINQAVSIADQEAEDKAKIDAANGVLTSQQSTRVNDVVSQLNSNKDVQAFMSIAGQIGVLNSIPAGTQDPAQQAALLASVAHILSPNSSSLRGALNAIDPNSLDSGVYNKLKSIASTFETTGKLSPDAVNNLIQIGTNEYNAYLTTYQSIRDAATAPLQSQGIDVNSYIPDYSNINGSATQTLQQQSSQAAELISNFGSQSSLNASILKNLATTMPNATTLEIAQTLGLVPAQ